jgi:hypothetical protein
MAEVELRRLVLGGGHRRLGAQVLQLLEADDLVGVEIFAALQIARRLFGELACLLDLCAHLGQLDLREALALSDHLAFLHVNAAHDAAHLERQPHLVFGHHESVGVDGRHCGPFARPLRMDRRRLVDRGGRRPAAAHQQRGHETQRDDERTHRVPPAFLRGDHAFTLN